MSARSPAPRVLFLFTDVYANGGIQRFNKTLLQACSGLGIGGVALSLRDPVVAATDDARLGNITIEGFAGDRRRFALAIARAALLGKFDHVLVGHINFVTMAAGLLSVGASRHCQALFTAHGVEVWSGLDRRRRRALARMDRILCVSHYTRDRILEQAPELERGRMAIFPNALAATWTATQGPSRGDLPARFVLSVTRLDPGDRYKGIPTVIEALSMLADRSLHYVVVGHGADLPFLRLVARRCGVEERVHFLRGITDAELTGLYRECLAFVLPSGKEGFGIVFLEAMFFGAPVVAAKEKGALDVVTDGKTGLLVPFGDTIAIKAAIERLAADAALRGRLIKNGRAQVTDGGPFTFERFAERCAQAFSSAAPALSS
jgi:glycosyltransferase involved in cell wall biosynthesis